MTLSVFYVQEIISSHDNMLIVSLASSNTNHIWQYQNVFGPLVKLEADYDKVIPTSPF